MSGYRRYTCLGEAVFSKQPIILMQIMHKYPSKSYKHRPIDFIEAWYNHISANS